MTRNPWLDIPLDDYVGHMSSPAVNQRPVLNRLLRDALQSLRPRAVLVLGGSSGNGLEHVDRAVTSRVAVVDINPDYLRRLAERFSDPGYRLETQCSDLADTTFEPEAYNLAHAGLVFEYVAWRTLLPRVATALRPGGTLTVVLQQPSASSPAVTPTEFASLGTLESIFHFVEPDALIEAARHAGLALSARRTEPLEAGKAFEVLRFLKSSGRAPSGARANPER